MLLLNSVFDLAVCPLQLLFRYQKLERTVWDGIEGDDRCRSMELEPIARDSAPAHGRYIPTTADTAPATAKSTLVAIARSPIPASAAPATLLSFSLRGRRYRCGIALRRRRYLRWRSACEAGKAAPHLL